MVSRTPSRRQGLRPGTPGETCTHVSGRLWAGSSEE